MIILILIFKTALDKTKVEQTNDDTISNEQKISTSSSSSSSSGFIKNNENDIVEAKRAVFDLEEDVPKDDVTANNDEKESEFLFRFKKTHQFCDRSSSTMSFEESAEQLNEARLDSPTISPTSVVNLCFRFRNIISILL